MIIPKEYKGHKVEVGDFLFEIEGTPASWWLDENCECEILVSRSLANAVERGEIPYYVFEYILDHELRECEEAKKIAKEKGLSCSDLLRKAEEQGPFIEEAVRAHEIVSKDSKCVEILGRWVHDIVFKWR